MNDETSELRIYGWSDDVLEFEGAIDEELNNPKGRIEVMLVDADEQIGLIIFAEYHDTWTLGVRQLGEGEIIPWPVSIVSPAFDGPNYSPHMRINVPTGAKLIEMPS